MREHPTQMTNHQTAQGFMDIVQQYRSLVTGEMQSGNLHIVVADQNMTDHHINWCISKGLTDAEMKVAELLLSVPVMARNLIWIADCAWRQIEDDDEW